jgi:hypothetical protein
MNRRRTYPLLTVFGLAIVAACSSKSSGGGGDGGAMFTTDASFDTGGDTSVSDGGPKDGTASDGDAAVTPISAGSTGAFGIVTVGGKQKLYLPTTTAGDGGDAVVAVVDVGVAGHGVAGAPALITSVDLGTTNYATTTGGDPTMVVAASIATNDVWFINPVTDTLVKHITLDGTFGTSSFSGGGGYVTGIAIEPVSHTAILSVWNGFALVDMATQTITKVIVAPPSENFGFDSAHGYIYAPYYSCTSATAPDGGTSAACGVPMTPGDANMVMTDGLSVIDVATGKVFNYEDPNALDPNNPVGSEPDSAGADPTSQIVMVPSEGNGYQNVIDFSKATFDMATMTVTAPHQVVQGVALEGVAIEPNSHIAFLEGEGSPNIAFINLPSANTGNQGWVGGAMPNVPGGANFSNLGDPHGIAVTTSIINGKAVGFVVDNSWQWVARVDLGSLATLEQADASVTAGTTQLQAAVTYLDATTIE